MNTKRNLLGSKTLVGDKVVNALNEDLGKIEELMISLRDGRIGYAVLSFGGLLGIGNKLFAVPWSILQVDQNNKCFMLNISKEKLENAPGFDKDHWPDMTDEKWGHSIYSYYEEQPYWD